MQRKLNKNAKLDKKMVNSLVADNFSTKFSTHPYHFNLLQGSVNWLFGLNGSGKSTLLKTLVKLQPPQQGTLLYGQVALSELPNYQLSTYIAFCSTEVHRPLFMTVQQYLLTALYPQNMGIKVQTNQLEQLKTLADGLKITHFLDRNLSELSDGEHKKVTIARTLFQQTPIVLFDEPMTHLDPIQKTETMQFLCEYLAQNNKIGLISSHDLELSIQFSPNALIIDHQGQLLQKSISSVAQIYQYFTA